MADNKKADDPLVKCPPCKGKGRIPFEEKLERCTWCKGRGKVKKSFLKRQKTRRRASEKYLAGKDLELDEILIFWEGSGWIGPYQRGLKLWAKHNPGTKAWPEPRQLVAWLLKRVRELERENKRLAT